MFSPANKATACGMWSPTYIIALTAVLVLIAAGLHFSKKMSHRGVRRVLIAAAIFSISTEILKMIFIGVTYGIEQVEFTPLYFCSAYMYALVLSLCKGQRSRTTGLCFLFYGGILGAVAFFAYPSACIPRYPIYHFMCLRTMLYHGSMIYVGVLIAMTGVYQPCAKHYKNYAFMIGLIGVLAYVLNRITGENFMYISKPLNIPFFKIVYDAMPQLYPFLGILLQMTAPFWAMEAVRLVLTHKKERKEELNCVHN